MGTERLAGNQRVTRTSETQRLKLRAEGAQRKSLTQVEAREKNQRMETVLDKPPEMGERKKDFNKLKRP